MTRSHIAKSNQYWKNKILSWEKSAYYQDDMPTQVQFIDKLSSLFRGKRMYERMDTALELLVPYLEGSSVLDVGCASGKFATKMISEGHASRVIGIDVAECAIQQATTRYGSIYQDQLDFMVADVTQTNSLLPEGNLVTALGVIEYFDEKSLSNFLHNIKSKDFFLDFPLKSYRRTLSPEWWLRKIYLTINRCPGVYFYSQKEFSQIAARAGFTNIRIIKKNGFNFITNLPKI